MILHLFNEQKLSIDKDSFTKMEQFFLSQLRKMKEFDYPEYGEFCLECSQFKENLRNEQAIKDMIVSYKQKEKVDVVSSFYHYGL